MVAQTTEMVAQTTEMVAQTTASEMAQIKREKRVQTELCDC
jgi:hypothetical protein